MVKNLPAIQKTWIRSLGQEDSLEKEPVTYSSIRAWGIRERWRLLGYSPWGHKESDATEQLSTVQSHSSYTVRAKEKLELRFPVGNGSPLQYSCLEKSHGWRSLVGCSPWSHEEWDTTERLCFHFSLSCIREGNGNPLQCSCLENPRGGRAWWTAVYEVAQSWTRLKWLSSSSISTLHFTAWVLYSVL